jgi:phenylpyruvate tautomerase PptA (4-oxalocrotonate tautomerase family)
MPAITIQSLELTTRQKEILADKFVTIFSEITQLPKDRIYIFFDGYTVDSAGTGGWLFSQKPPAPNIICKYNQDQREKQGPGAVPEEYNGR